MNVALAENYASAGNPCDFGGCARGSVHIFVAGYLTKRSEPGG